MCVPCHGCRLRFVSIQKPDSLAVTKDNQIQDRNEAIKSSLRWQEFRRRVHGISQPSSRLELENVQCRASKEAVGDPLDGGTKIFHR